MAVKLTKKQLENIKNYKYATSDWTPLDHVFNPWWEFVVKNLSKVSLSRHFNNLTNLFYRELHQIL